MRIDLKGKWDYRIDREEIGIKDKWYKELIMDGELTFPGTTSEAKIGEKLNLEPKINKDTVKRLREHYSYIGVMWYSKKISIPDSASNKEIYLYLERIMWESMVWIDDNYIGTFDSLSTPHKFRITGFVEAGKEHKITIRIDNREKYNIKEFPSAYTQETQSIWNGIVGELLLEVKEKTNIEKVKVFPDIKEKELNLEVEINNYSKNKAYSLELEVIGFDKKSIEILLPNDKNYIKCNYKLEGDIELWNEFNPYIYILNCTLKDENIEMDSKETEFGIREISTEGRHIFVNGERVFLRGTLDCCIYPLTGYPPTSMEEWIKVFNILKEYGLNHVRFHSWCPPENAFKAADRCGIYVQAEGPIWLDDYFCEIGSYEGHYKFFPVEAKRIVEEYANHPSFIIFSNGNEIRGDFKLLNNIVKELKKHDKRLLYTLTTNWDREVFDGDDVFIAQSFDDIGVRGQYFLSEMVEGTELNFDKAVATRNLPTLSHEVGQYSIYPDVREINKYTGVLRPINLEAIKNDLEEKNLIDDIGKFVTASGKLAVNLYKDDIEAALRTRDLSGVQLLDLHDFSGQSTATVGILNAFWESKGLINPKDFKGFFGDIVLLMVTKKRIYSSDEEFEFKVLVSNYSNENIVNAKINYRIKNKNEVVFDGQITTKLINKGSLVDLNKNILIDLNSIKENSMLKVELDIEGTKIKNSWNIWVYKSKIKENNKIVSSVKELIDAVNNKENVIVNLNSENMSKPRKNKYFPCFWSPVHFETSDPNGLYLESESELMKDFPTEEYGDYQWKRIVEDSQIISIADIKNKIDNIAQVVPNFYCNEAMSIMFATKIKNSKVVFTSIDFADIENKIVEVQALYNSLVNNIDNLKVDANLELKEVIGLFK